MKNPGALELRTCMWQKDQNILVRVGPLELVKNGILILRTQTNPKGKLHGPYASWNDEGELLEKGDYLEGLKEGLWIKIKADGDKETVFYKAGIPVKK